MWALRQQFVRLDRICAAMNGWLLALVIGLMILDFTVLIVKALEALPLPQPVATGEASHVMATPPFPPIELAG